LYFKALIHSMVNKILDRAFEKAKKIPLEKDAKLIFFSDLHKGDNSYADDFRQNYSLYQHALQSYFDKGYTYIEPGDGIELWENTSFEPIYKTHESIFDLLRRFHWQNRLHLLWGNHDMEFRDPIFVEKIMRTFFTPKILKQKDRFFDLAYEESLLLQFDNEERGILVFHGHQADYMNYAHWKFNRFFVRYFWKYMQKWFGVSDPTSPAKNHKGLIRVEKKLHEWIVKRGHQMVICGHTHRPRFPGPDEIPLFNDGSCVHPKSITGIEINNFEISLVKWHLTTDDGSSKKIIKTILEGPVSLKKYL